MPLSRSSLLTIATVVALATTGTALMAQPGPWGRSGWGDSSDWGHAGSRRAPSLEGRIEVARFRAEGAALDPSGPIAVGPMADEAGSSDPRINATFQAAVESKLLASGFAALPSGSSQGPIAEVRVVRSEAAPAEEKRKPLSGEMSMGVSNHGTMLGLGLRYDATKPRAALLSTRLETRIKDRTTGAVLWEGRAEIVTREGDDKWDDQAIADKLAKVLFDGFPGKVGEQTLKR
jgi:hypothetical protein